MLVVAITFWVLVSLLALLLYSVCVTSGRADAIVETMEAF
jgi:hypothetical protein